ncbi:hypothetical protein K7W42_02160 [Deinococcus sp. HMF7604]|uniref:hypothetical protein n=1 Tax=Deinococcus betulae TaxID=2873312 RepID=UPI001CC95786|nr:hypothetical protein [Deinococcus betulae]MBZ9749661.1 hypothetical protein [Deinococcus betulae]
MLLSPLLLTAVLTPPALVVQVAAVPGLALSAQAPSTVTVTANGKSQVLALSGPPDPAHPEALARVRDLPVSLPSAHTGPVTVSVKLFLCDRARGLCTVQEQSRRVMLTPGRPVTVTFTPRSARQR